MVQQQKEEPQQAGRQPFFAALAANRGMHYFCLALLLLTLYIYYPAPLGGDYDIGFHLRFGEHYVQNHTWNIDQSVFSWTPASAEWKYVTWLGSSVLYLAYQAASYNGLIIIYYLIFLVTASLYLSTVRAVGDRLDISHIMAMLLAGIALGATASLVKPETFTVFFFALILFIYLYSKARSKTLFFLYPPLFLVWVNTHGGFIIGLLFLSITLLGELANYAFFRKDPLSRKMLIHLAAALVLSYMVMLINPHGVGYPVQLYKDFFDKEYHQLTEHVRAYVSVWKFIIPKSLATGIMTFSSWVMILMALLQALFTWYAYRKKRYFDPAISMTSLSFFFIGMSVARLSMFYPLTWLFSMTWMIKKAEIPEARKAFGPVALFLFLLVSGYSLFTAFFYKEQPPWQAARLDEVFPEREVKFIKENKIPGPFFNDYLMGGYMIWALPEEKVFVDTRGWPFMGTVMPDYIFYMENPTPERLSWLSAKYPFKSALIHLSEHKTVLSFLQSPDWRLIYIDRMACIFVHASIIDKLDPAVFRTDTEYFRDLKNPEVLSRLFNFLITIDVDPRHPREIMNFYRNNVRASYLPKKDVLQSMEKTLSAIEKERTDNAK